MELYKLTIHEASDLLHRGEISSRELTKSVLERIEATESKLHSFISIHPEAALKQADKADWLRENPNSKELHVLTGIPFALKDNICTRGIRTTCASRLMEQFNPSIDGAVVKKLKNAHAVLIGKLNMDEFAIGSSGRARFFLIPATHGLQTEYPAAQAAAQLLLLQQTRCCFHWAPIQEAQ